jgi:hypothetical protein
MLPRKLSHAPSRKVCKLDSESLFVAIKSIRDYVVNIAIIVCLGKNWAVLAFLIVGGDLAGKSCREKKGS